MQLERTEEYPRSYENSTRGALRLEATSHVFMGALPSKYFRFPKDSVLRNIQKKKKKKKTQVA